MDQKLLNFLKELKKYGIENNIPNVTERGGRFLNTLIYSSGSKNILEIGCANGYSTIWMADAVKSGAVAESSSAGKIYAIDHSKPTFESAQENLKKVGLSDVVDFYFGNALEVISQFDQKFDFVFVDGEKRSYWDFWNSIQSKITSNTIIVFDDILSFPHKTEAFMKKIEAVIGWNQVVLPIDSDDGVLLLYKQK